MMPGAIALAVYNVLLRPAKPGDRAEGTGLRAASLCKPLLAAA
jgi:hypothetical protein